MDVLIQKKDVAQIAQETGTPYERVEWILVQIERDVDELVGRQLELRLRYGEDEEEGAGDRDGEGEETAGEEPGEEMEQDGF